MQTPLPLEHTAHTIVRRLQEAGFEALYAGGCVRDMLRGVVPYDYDIATTARPEEIQSLFRRTLAIGAAFGVINVLENGADFQVATFRCDGDYQDGRHPESVEFSNAEEDAKRRDFTINGLFFDPVKQELRDYVGGREDLAKRSIRAIGDAEQRFAEDRLRMLRAIRFATVLGFEIEPATWEAIQKHAGAIHEVSAERIRDELLKTLHAPQRVRGFDLLDASGLLKEILPEMERLKGCEQPPQFHPEGDVWVHTRLMLSLLPEQVSTPLLLSVLFHDIAKPATYSFDPAEGRIRFSGHEKLGAEMTAEILSRLRIPGKELEATVEAVLNHMAFKDVQKMRVARLKRFLARPTMPDELQLHRVDCASSNGDLSNFTFLQNKLEEFSSEPLIPPPLVTGKDLIELGHNPGPEFKTVLEEMQSLQLEGTLADREAALTWLKTHYPPAGGH
ncbi:MAG: CCA tRNA nucleotidyltransferase [Verrucomicrobiota bacterium]